MKMRWASLVLVLVATTSAAPSEKRLAAREKALAWLAESQSADGSWGNQYKTAVTAIACLAHLASSDEPFGGQRGPALVRGLQFLMTAQKEGMFPHEGHTWIHGQGFAALALSEAYGRSLLAKERPDIDMSKVRAALQKAVKVIQDNQSTSGGWWYTPGSKGQHEGSTTVTAVQALVSAANFGLEIDAKVLDAGFEYLKRCQNRDGGFDYQLDDSRDTVSMKEGTAADVATLALMKKFDYSVMVNGFKFLIKLTPQAITKERFPYYGHFYACMGMKLFAEELASYEKDARPYIDGALADVLALQKDDGTWPVTGWIQSSSQEREAYSTAIAALILSVEDARLSIFNRRPPELPK
ncbi:MAG: terpene cyclase/mutase family protein [Planctomycetes bacterium]|nr:terpene cyclase/mutase family protein [Planctomycetota bacterium]